MNSGSSGSPAGEPVYLAVGFLRRPHGVQGEIIMDLHTDFPERLKAGRKLFVGESHRAMKVAGLRPHGDGRLVRFEGVDSPEEAGIFRNQWVFIKAADAAPLPEGQLYQHQLYGLNVVDDQGRELGQLTEIIETGANDVYVVTDSTGREVLLPAIPAVILEIDAVQRVMRVHLLDGLLDEPRS
ncbi:MAG TPA: ribosome maturation factor RimM [Anaerolineales bacterium]